MLTIHFLILVHVTPSVNKQLLLTTRELITVTLILEEIDNPTDLTALDLVQLDQLTGANHLIVNGFLHPITHLDPKHPPATRPIPLEINLLQ